MGAAEGGLCRRPAADPQSGEDGAHQGPGRLARATVAVVRDRDAQAHNGFAWLANCRESTRSVARACTLAGGEADRETACGWGDAYRQSPDAMNGAQYNACEWPFFRRVSASAAR